MQPTLGKGDRDEWCFDGETRIGHGAALMFANVFRINSGPVELGFAMVPRRIPPSCGFAVMRGLPDSGSIGDRRRCVTRQFSVLDKRNAR